MRMRRDPDSSGPREMRARANLAAAVEADQDARPGASLDRSDSKRHTCGKCGVSVKLTLRKRTSIGGILVCTRCWPTEVAR